MLYTKNMTKQARHLLELFAPGSYSLQLDISQRAERVFRGEVVIHGSLPKANGSITLHTHELEVASATIDGKEATYKLVPEDDELVISAPQELSTGGHEVRVAFSGKITDPMHGLYPCYFKLDGQDRELLMTQFESHYAREVFPCIDEPGAKATFDLTLTTESDVTVLGNTPIKQQQRAEANDALITTFETTPKMSTYLLAFAAGPLGYKEMTSKHGVKIRTYATPDKVEQTAFGLQFAADVLDFFDDYFDIPYPLAKCDMLAAPDFASGAMENWGLVTYRESCMLFDPANSPADRKEIVAAVIAHELSHQWFGNLVTMQWWDDLWLNESFAKWMEHYSVDKLKPEWQVWNQFSGHEQQYAFSRDSLANVQAVQQPVNHPDELHSLFDPAIVYAKGSCLIRMLQNYVGEEAFRDSLRLYMQRHQYGNTAANDLWAALSEVSGKDVASFMDPWIHQPGHPVVSVTTAGDQFEFKQSRFYANPLQAKQSDTAVWPVPLLSEQLAEQSLTEQHKTMQPKSDEFLLNKNYTGFYHTQYDSAHLAKLAQHVDEGKLAVVDRLGLLADNLALARAGRGSTVDLTKLLAHYAKEDSYPVWMTIAGVLGALKLLINHDPELKPHLQRYSRRITEAQFTRLGWDKIAGESYFDELLRPSMISAMTYAEVPEVIQHALQLFDKADKAEDLPADLRSIIYSVAIRERGESAYQRLLEWYKATTSNEERTNLIFGITAVKDETLAQKITEHFTTKLIKLQDLDYWFVYLIRNRYGYQAAWNWMTSHWDWITKQFKGSHDYPDYPKYAAGGMSTRDQLDAYRQFFEPKLNELDLAMVIRQSLEDIEVRVLWRERDLAGVAEFLKGQ